LAPRPQPVILFRVESHLLAFQLGRPIHTLVEWADLEKLLREPGVHYVVTRTEYEAEVREHAGDFEILARSEGLAQTKKHRPLILLRFRGKPCLSPPRD
jgi:hypothetical protein